MYKTTVRNLLIPFLIAIIIGLIHNIISIFLILFNTTINYSLDIWIYSNDLLNFIYPIYCTVPFCWLMYYERKDGFIKYVHNRISVKSYLVKKYLFICTTAAICIFIISFSGAIIALLPNHWFSDFKVDVNIMGIDNPLLYSFTLSIWRSIIGFLFCSFGFILSLYIDNLFVIVSFPFIYSIIENFTLSILGMPSISISTSFNPNRLAPGYVKLYDIIIGPIILIFITVILFLVMRKRKGIIYG